jgi:ectoine hydroxylase-related dioxygenase (phytanoyl-CoA dioxygenase family)
VFLQDARAGAAYAAKHAPPPSETLMNPTWYTPDSPRLADLQDLLDTGRAAPRPLLASELLDGVPVYDLGHQPFQARSDADQRALMAEWHAVFDRGAGVLVLRGAWADRGLIDAATAAFHALIDREKAERAAHGKGQAGDHFAKAGANDRVWNAAQKLCLAEPALFARYYANPALAAVCRAWLGPGYQVTSQLNCVNPGGAAQEPHRDYHLGFMNAEQAVAYPVAVHHLSPGLTLQGAVAHGDMPLESGPTLLLPHSQKYGPGYLVAGRPEFNACFAQRHVQLPLQSGDGLFFNPALIHAAGTNRSTHIRRLANLLQVSSAFGRAMESVDRVAMALALYPALQAETQAGRLDTAHALHAIAACAEGYAFPTNLDRDPPLGGLAPQSQQALMAQALAEGWTPARFASTLHVRAGQQRA